MSTKLVTERLLLEPLHPDDNSFIAELVNTEGWLRFIGDKNVHSEEQAGLFIRKIIDDPDTNYWVVKLKKNCASIGIVTFIRREYLDYNDIGCAFLPLYINNGYAYEATRALLYHGIDTSVHTRVCGITREDNVGAIKLLNKLGFQSLRDLKIKNENLQLYEASVDKIFVTDITRSFFSAFTNKGGRRPDLDMLNDICIPETSLTTTFRSRVDVSNLSSFIDKRKRILTDGTLQEFEEREIFEETKIIRGIATRFSRYEKKGIAYRQRFKMTGHKFFHFVKTKNSWKISSILWADDDN